MHFASKHHLTVELSEDRATRFGDLLSDALGQVGDGIYGFSQGRFSITVDFQPEVDTIDEAYAVAVRLLRQAVAAAAKAMGIPKGDCVVEREHCVYIAAYVSPYEDEAAPAAAPTPQPSPPPKRRPGRSGWG